MMARLIAALLALPPLIATVMAGMDALSIGLTETLLTICLITAFAVLAAGWTLRRSLRP